MFRLKYTYNIWREDYQNGCLKETPAGIMHIEFFGLQH